jgi:hypothetical protein
MSATLEITAPNLTFSSLADPHRVARVAAALESNGIQSFVVDTGAEAKEIVLSLLPEGAEVFDSVSQTLIATGITAEITESGRYQTVRSNLMELYAQGDRNGMRKLGSAPQIMIGSVHAITEDGDLLVGSGTGSQLGPYAYSAGQIIWVVGTQKIVKDIDEGLRRIREYSLPRENIRMQSERGVSSSLNKILIIHRESAPQRATVVLVNEDLGF